MGRQRHDRLAFQCYGTPQPLLQRRPLWKVGTLPVPGLGPGAPLLPLSRSVLHASLLSSGRYFEYLHLFSLLQNTTSREASTQKSLLPSVPEAGKGKVKGSENRDPGGSPLAWVTVLLPRSS